MIAIVDPALLQPRADAEVREELTLAHRACRQYHLRLVPFEEYWAPMWRQFGRQLERQLKDPNARNALRELRKLGQRYSSDGIPPAPPSVAWRRGFEQLFAPRWLSAGWEQIMARVVVRAVATREEVVLLTRRIQGRNLLLHAASNCVLHENTRWLLHVQPRGFGPCHVPCVHHPRNLSLRWTTRFDWRLPAEQDGSRYPFCPPDRWWDPAIAACDTVSGKPAWVDSQNRGWARPNIPGGDGYHWDVFITSPNEQRAIGVNQLDVVQFGAPPSEGIPGHIHHVPAKKKPLVNDVGWSCP